MRSEPLDAAQVKLTIAEHFQELRMLPRRPRDRDPQIRFRLGQMKHFSAVTKHRRAGLASIQPARFHFADVRDEVGFDPPRLMQELRQTSKQLII